MKFEYRGCGIDTKNGLWYWTKGDDPVKNYELDLETCFVRIDENLGPAQNRVLIGPETVDWPEELENQEFALTRLEFISQAPADALYIDWDSEVSRLDDPEVEVTYFGDENDEF